MGSNPLLLNLKMCWWECTRICGSDNIFRPHVKIYFRYTDDLTPVVEEGFGDLNSFLTCFKDNDRNLKVTGHKSDFFFMSTLEATMTES